jgi:hypothetical protein
VFDLMEIQSNLLGDYGGLTGSPLSGTQQWVAGQPDGKQFVAIA